MADKIKVLVIGMGHMGASHADAYHRSDKAEIVGLFSRSMKSATLPEALASYPRFEDYEEALAVARPDAVSINSYPDTHAEYALRAFEAGCHVFMEKPIATTIEDAEKVVAAAHRTGRKLVLGYILRFHPAWTKFVELAQTMGKPLAMRMNLNQQSLGEEWHWHYNLMQSLTPIVDCGVHYIDVMIQMTSARPVRVHGIGAHLWGDVKTPNYGHLHVTFDDGSVGWYEAGWGPMMSETASFVKDVIGPKGSVSIVVDDDGRSADINRHTRTDMLRVHHAAVDDDKRLIRPDDLIAVEDDPGHQELCDREQDFFLDAILNDRDLSASMTAAVDSLRVVLAAAESIETGQTVVLAPGQSSSSKADETS